MYENRYIILARQIGFWLLIAGILIFTLFPFYWAVVGSFKSEVEIKTPPATYFPQRFVLNNYAGEFNDPVTGQVLPRGVFRNSNFLQGLFNSAIVSGFTVLTSLVVGSFAAYAIGRLRFRGRTIMLYLILAMTMFPLISILSGLFTIVRELGIFGSLVSLIITYPIFSLPFTVWVLVSFFKGLPGELEQAALVDGATPFQTFYMVLLPLTAPALVTTGLLAFIGAWNEYLLAVTFTVTNNDAWTVPVAIARFTGSIPREEPIAEPLAATVIVTIPLVILVLVFQRRIIQGLTAGAVKG
jgi:trehalose/maltose transport system permease protein